FRARARAPSPPPPPASAEPRGGRRSLSEGWPAARPRRVKFMRPTSAAHELLRRWAAPVSASIPVGTSIIDAGGDNATICTDCSSCSDLGIDRRAGAGAGQAGGRGAEDDLVLLHRQVGVSG